MAQAHPTILEYRVGLASAWSEVGVVYETTNRPKEAEAALRKPLEVQEGLVRQQPKMTEVALDLADTLCMLGHLGRDDNRPADAVPWYTRSLELVVPIFKAQPRSERARLAARRAYQGRAIVLTRLGRYAEALPDWDRRVELDQGLSREWVLLQRARVYAKLGDHAKAAAEAEAVVGRVGKEGNLLHDAAVAQAVAATAAANDAGLTAAERDARKDRHTARAVQLLGQAHAAGYYRKSAARELLAKDKDLAVLREREDYKKVVMDVQAEANKPSKE